MASIFGHQAVFYAAVLNVVNTFAVFTIGTILVVGDLGDGKRFQKKVLYSTPMLSAYLAMLIVALGISDIPGIISQPLTMIGNITVPWNSTIRTITPTLTSLSRIEPSSFICMIRDTNSHVMTNTRIPIKTFSERDSRISR